eukprot:snap_masked-scaffold_23-processed-gene-2.16-mRNA-1 protein AED:0.02 eAED:0.02 QI:0/-1/0/1/-1/1/1/0/135
MADPVSIRFRRFMTNPLLNRKQFIIDIYHPKRASISKAELREKLAQKFSADESCFVLYDFKTQFGGGKSSGNCCFYNTAEDAKKYHGMKHHLWRSGLIEKPSKLGRKGIKEGKNKGKKTRGLGRRIARKKARRAE